MIRPERITLQDAGAPVSQGHNAIGGTVAEVVYLGSCTQVHVDVGAPSSVDRRGAQHVRARVGDPSAGGGGDVRLYARRGRVLHRSTAKPITDPVADEAEELSPSSL